MKFSDSALKISLSSSLWSSKLSTAILKHSSVDDEEILSGDEGSDSIVTISKEVSLLLVSRFPLM